jgi:hypothetical protein
VAVLDAREVEGGLGVTVTVEVFDADAPYISIVCAMMVT